MFNDGILQKVAISNADLEFVAKHYEKNPDLALFYFHCCTNHPDAYVFNDAPLPLRAASLNTYAYV